MQLTYRGIRYNTFNQPTEIIQSSEEGKFRGARYRIVSAKTNLLKRHVEQLSYRLAKYNA